MDFEITPKLDLTPQSEKYKLFTHNSYSLLSGMANYFYWQAKKIKKIESVFAILAIRGEYQATDENGRLALSKEQQEKFKKIGHDLENIEQELITVLKLIEAYQSNEIKY